MRKAEGGIDKATSSSTSRHTNEISDLKRFSQYRISFLSLQNGMYATHSLSNRYANSPSSLPSSTSNPSYSFSCCSYARAHTFTTLHLASWIGIRTGTKCDSRRYRGDGADNTRFMGIFWKCARIGERLSPYISICCVLMAVRRNSFLCCI